MKIAYSLKRSRISLIHYQQQCSFHLRIFELSFFNYSLIRKNQQNGSTISMPRHGFEIYILIEVERLLVQESSIFIYLSLYNFPIRHFANYTYPGLGLERGRGRPRTTIFENFGTRTARTRTRTGTRTSEDGDF